MSKGVNRVILVGNLGADPEYRDLPSGSAVVNLRLATNSKHKDKSGEWVDETEWHSVVCFGALANICREHLTKGAQIYVEGRLQTRDWKDRSGADRKTTEVVANEMLMLGGRESNRANDNRRPEAPDYKEHLRDTKKRQATNWPKPGDPRVTPSADFDDDIPF